VKTPTRRRSNDGWGVALAHRNVGAIIAGIAELPAGEQVAALRKAPRAIHALLYFSYGPHVIDLPKGPLSYALIPTSAYVDDPRAPPDEDLLAREAHSLVRFFAVGVHPTLTSGRRLELWRDIQARLPRAERELLDHARSREIQGITRETVDAAFPGMLEIQPAPEPPVQGIEYGPSSMDNPTPIVEASKPATPPAPREPTEGERRYSDMMRRMGFDRL